MPFNELSRSAIGLAQELDELEAAHDPRQAWVTRAEGNGVWVRFRRNGTEPESWFPSTHAGLPAGFMGWVYPIGGGKGLFVVTGIWQPQTLESGAMQTATISTSGTLVMNPTVSFTDLNPGRTYQMDATVGLNLWTSAASGLNRYTPGVSATTASGTATIPAGSNNNDALLSTRQPYLFRIVADVTPTSNGELHFSPTVTWNAGTITTRWSQIAVTLR